MELYGQSVGRPHLRHLRCGRVLSLDDWEWKLSIHFYTSYIHLLWYKNPLKLSTNSHVNFQEWYLSRVCTLAARVLEMSTCLQHTFLHLLFAHFSTLTRNWHLSKKRIWTNAVDAHRSTTQVPQKHGMMTQPTGPRLCHRQRRILPWRHVSAWRGPRAAGPPPP